MQRFDHFLVVPQHAAILVKITYLVIVRSLDCTVHLD